MRRVRKDTSRNGVICCLAGILLLAAGAGIARAQSQSSDGDSIIHHLNVAISWYRQVSRANEAAGEASDAFYFENARSLARQALQSAFDSAEAQVELLPASSGAANTPASGTAQERSNLTAAAAKAAEQTKQVQAQIDNLDKQIAKAAGNKLKSMTLQRQTLQQVLALDQAVQDAIDKLQKFASGNGGGQAGLTAEIEDLKKSVPDVFQKAPTKGENTTAPAPAPGQAATSAGGLIGHASQLISRLEDLHSVDQLTAGAVELTDLARGLQAPLLVKLKDDIQEARALGGQPPPADPAEAEATQKRLQALSAEFKKISGAALPLSQEIIALDQCRSNFQEWQGSIHRECVSILWLLLVRVFAVLIGLGAVMIFSRLWRRGTFKYVREPRHRHQLLLIQRFVTVFLMATVIVLGFVSEFSSLATFAGFITAGIAVALQAVILSVAAYFFLVGRYGVRVGDRITAGGVTGDVVDVGLVRFYVMELSGTGADMYPTGRLVVLPNSLLFQSAPFFKQIPGTTHAWHEVSLTLPSGSDFGRAESQLLEAVNQVYSEYGGGIEGQYESSESLMNSRFSSPKPHSSWQLDGSGLDLIVRYPVDIHRESEIDSKISRKVMEVIGGDPALKSAVASMHIRSSVKV
jgi:small-conductance mechanosensitive channel